MRRDFWRRQFRRLLVLLLVGAAAWFSRGWWLPRVGHFLDDADPIRQSDAVMVLGGGPDTRPFVAAALVKRGLAGRVLIPTVRYTPQERDQGLRPHHELIHMVLLARGVTDDRIDFLPEICASTEDEASALAKYLEDHPESKVTVVTSDFHTRRARILFRRELGARADRVSFVGAPIDYVNADNWWQSERGWITYTTEYVKLIATWLHEIRPASGPAPHAERGGQEGDAKS
jgi:uncharacterized SAM-binding protein YcdF (DUF218 family)